MWHDDHIEWEKSKKQNNPFSRSLPEVFPPREDTPKPENKTKKTVLDEDIEKNIVWRVDRRLSREVIIDHARPPSLIHTDHSLTPVSEEDVSRVLYEFRDTLTHEYSTRLEREPFLCMTIFESKSDYSYTDDGSYADMTKERTFERKNKKTIREKESKNPDPDDTPTSEYPECKKSDE